MEALLATGFIAGLAKVTCGAAVALDMTDVHRVVTRQLADEGLVVFGIRCPQYIEARTEVTFDCEIEFVHDQKATLVVTVTGLKSPEKVDIF